MGQTLLGVLGLFSLSALLCCGHAQDAVLTIEPNWSTLFTGESVSFICDMKEGGETDWFYSFKKKGYQFVNYNTNKIIKLQLLTEDSGDYQCVSQHKHSGVIKRSNTVSLTVSDDDVILEHPALTVFRGESVPLRCRRRTQTDGRRASFYRDASPIDMDTNHPSQIISENTAEATVRVAADGSSYMCKFDEHEQSKPTKLNVEPHRPKATLRRDTGSGPNVTLTCSVTGTSSAWKYYWYRGKKTSEPLTKEEGLLLSDDTIRVSQEGIYWCRGGRGEPVYYTQYSNTIVTLRPVVTLQPKWPKIYRGERISLTCQIEDGGDAEWEYVWTKGTSPLTERTNVYKISYASTSVNGDYRCMGEMKGDWSPTEWSDVFTLTVSEKTLTPGLQVTPSWLSPGASVTLTCSLEHPSAGWRFFWYKAVPKLPNSYYSYEMLPGSINGTTQDSYIVSGQTHTAGYVCRAGRGDPVQHTYHSGSKFVWCRDFHSALFLTVSPDRVQHFDSDSVSLSCEGNSTEWRVMTFDGRGYPSLCRTSPTATGPICKQNLWRSAAVYWCESGSGQFSSAVNITVHNDGIILESPVQPVVEGTSVTLGCSLKTENVPSNVLFYKNNKHVQHDTRRELTIAAVSKSHEGLYKCERTDSKQVWTSAESWMSVKLSSESSAFPLPLTVGLVGGLSFIVLLLLLLLFCIRKSKGSCFIRSQRTNQSSATDHVINQDEAPGDACVYELIKGPEVNENDESRDVIYSSVELKTLVENGKSTPAVADETVYSEVKTRKA